MTAAEKISAADLDSLSIIKYPSPQLRETCTPIEAVDRDLLTLVGRMSKLMFANRGVGLAASQVGVTVRVFLASPNFDTDDLHVYINPKILSGEGSATDEEGCLSFPGIFCKVKRCQKVVVEATGLDGQVFQHTAEGLHARICQHELDHLDGQLLVDRMGSVARLTHRKALAALEEQFAG